MTAAVTDLDGMPVRWLATSSPGRLPDLRGLRTPLVVVLPGLGMTRYVRRLVRALARRSVTAVVLDLPGFGSPGPRPTVPHIEDVGHADARWVERAGGARGPIPRTLLA